ncbi:MAG: hypothetical protein M1834_004502 [Cirrosporium novae-zelandiae]|nr:MAG: hypothetical protein M1834_004502 [Cirrosporium novae-zelandiae]
MDKESLNDSDDSSEINPTQIDESLIPAPTRKQNSTTDVTFDGLLSPPLRVRENLKNGCGGQIWEAGVVLAKYLLRYHRDDLKDKNMFVQFQADGVGASSSLAVEEGLWDQKVMLSLMRGNVELNQLQSKVKAEILDWGSPISESIPTADVILAADCVYFEPAFPLLLETLHALLVPGTVCYFCFRRRRRADMKFIKALRKAFLVKEIEEDIDKENYSRQNIHLYAVSKK